MVAMQIAILPALLLLIYVYRCDVYQKEPLWLLMKVFFYGFFVVSVGAIFLEFVLSWLGARIIGSETVLNLVQISLIAPFVEEIMKFLILLKLVWNNPNFDEYFDGIVYAAYIALGFACLENILYVIGGGIEVALSRAVFSVPGHFFFSVIMGYFFALARFKPQKKYVYLGMAIGGAITAHICFNTILCFVVMKESVLNTCGFFIFFLVLWRIAVARLHRLSLLSYENLQETASGLFLNNER